MPRRRIGVLHDRRDVGRAHRLSRVADLEIAPTPVRQRLRELRPVPLGVEEAHVAALRIQFRPACTGILDPGAGGVRP
jgi:hypothetical protein